MQNTNSVHTPHFFRIIHKPAPCQRFRFGTMEIRTRNLEKWQSSRKCADRLRRGEFAQSDLACQYHFSGV